jgi:hypothetical protein
MITGSIRKRTRGSNLSGSCPVLFDQSPAFQTQPLEHTSLGDVNRVRGSAEIPSHIAGWGFFENKALEDPPGSVIELRPDPLQEDFDHVTVVLPVP